MKPIHYSTPIALLAGFCAVVITATAAAQDTATTKPAPHVVDHVAMDDPAEILSADTSAFVQINDLSQWRKQIADDPLMQPIMRMLPPYRRQFAWLGVQQTLGIGGDDILDNYCGRRLVIARTMTKRGPGTTLLMRVQPEQAQQFIRRMPLEPIERAGSFEMFSTPDNLTRIAVHQRWIALSRSSQEREMRAMLRHGSKVLAGDEQFKSWFARLPAQRRVVGFFRDSTNAPLAAVAMTDDRQVLSLHYVGKPPRSDAWFAKLGDDDEPESPDLPRATLAAMSVNITPSRLLEPTNADLKTSIDEYNAAVAPYLVSPTVFIAGYVNIQTPDHPKSRSWPALAVALHFSDRAAAIDVSSKLTRLIGNLITYANMQGSNVVHRTTKYQGVLYHIAEIGRVLATRYEQADLKHIRLVYGQVGSWYVIASHGDFFNALIDAANDSSQRIDYDSFACPKLDRPCGRAVATGFVRPGAVAEQLGTWIDYWNATRPSVVGLAQFEPRNLESRTAKHVLAAQAFFNSAKLITARFHKDAAENLVVGRVDVVRN